MHQMGTGGHLDFPKKLFCQLLGPIDYTPYVTGTQNKLQGYINDPFEKLMPNKGTYLSKLRFQKGGGHIRGPLPYTNRVKEVSKRTD